MRSFVAPALAARARRFSAASGVTRAFVVAVATVLLAFQASGCAARRESCRGTLRTECHDVCDVPCDGSRACAPVCVPSCELVCRDDAAVGPNEAADGGGPGAGAGAADASIDGGPDLDSGDAGTVSTASFDAGRDAP